MTQSRRQPGSVFKTFVYAAALEQGWLPTDSVSDAAVAITMPAGNVWRPENYDRKARNGVVSLETALAKSLNRATVRLGMGVGVSRVAATARTMGLREPVAVRPASLLGAGEVRPIDLLAAYAPIARADGHRLRTRTIVGVTDAHGHVLLANPAVVEPGLDPLVAARLRGMLVTAVERGTGRQVRAAGYEGPVAGKTGTTNGTTNAWFVGVTPEYVAGVWVGYDLPRAILPDGSATGGRVAAPIWAEVMRHFPVVRAEWPQSEESPDPETVEEESPEPTVQPDPAPLPPAAPPMAGPALPPAPAVVFGAAWLADSLVTP
jgi:penicillin-binding protein 1A